MIVDSDQLTAFIAAMFRHADADTYASARTFLELEDGPPVDIKGVRLNGGDREILVRAIVNRAQLAAGYTKPCVFAPPIATFSNGKRARETDLRNGLALSVELDQNAAAARQCLELLLGTATVVVASGGSWVDPVTGEVQDKIHIHWRLREPTRDAEAHASLKQARTLATRLVGGDCTNKPVVHPIRWPGSWHRKAEPKLCQIIALNPDVEIDLDAALASLLDVAPEFRSHSEGAPATHAADEDDRDTGELVRRVITGSEYHSALRDLAWRFSKGGMAPAQITLTLRGIMDGATEPHDERWQHRRDQIPMLLRTAREKIEAAEADWPDPDMVILSDHRIPAPIFPIEVFGTYWSEWIIRQAEAKSSPPDYVAASLLSGASVLIGNARWGSPWDGWAEPPVLWFAGVGNPSSGKSPGQDATYDLLTQIEIDANAGRKEALVKWDTAARAAKLHLEVWEGDCKAAIKKEFPPPPRPEAGEIPPRPIRKRIATSDTTIEKAARILVENAKGLLLKRDELAGWVGSLERYGGSGSDRAFFIESYGGRPYVVDRVKDAEPIAVPALTIGICGGIQPDRLNTMVLTGDDDGLAARFIYVWPERVPPRRPTRSPPTGAKTKLKRLCELDEKLDAEDRRVAMPFSEPAAESLQNYRLQVAAAEIGLSGLFLSWTGKLPGMVVRLATVLEHLYWVGDREMGPPPTIVSERAAVAAIAFLDGYATPMARRCFGEAALPERDRDAIALARWIMAQNPIPDTVNARDLRHGSAMSTKDPVRYDAALAELADAGWLRRVIRPGHSVGRPRKDWAVNPRLRSQL